MNIFEDWYHPWFGNFREEGTFWKLCPSVLEFVDPDWDDSIRQRVLAYLEAGICVAASTRPPCIFHGRECFHAVGEGWGLCARTDGIWTWDDNLVHYVRHHQVRVPDVLVRLMEEKGFQVPEHLALSDDDWFAYGASLPHPPMFLEGDMEPDILYPLPAKPDMAEVRTAASAAFRARDYVRVVELFAPILSELSPAEKKKLAYAQARS